MCKSSLHDFLHALPKCEHHVHIEGTLTPSTLFALAKRNNVTLPADDPAYDSEAALLQRYKNFSSLDDFLGYYYRAMSVLVSQSDFEELTYAYLMKTYEDGVRHAEIFFDPQAHLDRVSFETVIEGIQAGCRRAERELDVTSLLIMCFLRHLGQEPALELFHAEPVQKYLRNGAIRGIGLDSSENGYPPELFQDVYRKAREMGLKLTAHAGEEGPAVNIEKSLDLLKCERIDHGLRVTDDPQLMKTVTERKILLSLCPLSNMYLRCVKEVSEVPIVKLLEAGVCFSINSDDPAYLGGFILDNYCAVQEAFSLRVSDWQKIGTNAVQGSWCSGARKQQLLEELSHVVGTFSQNGVA